MKKFMLTLLVIFFAYYCAFITSGASKKQSLFSFGDSNTMYKLKCALTGQTDTTDSRALFLRGESYLSQNQYESAIKDMQKVLLLDSSHLLARFVMGKAYLGIGDTVLAINTFLKQVTVTFEPHEAYFELGNIFKIKGLADSSYYYYKKSFEAHDKYPPVNYEIAQYFYKQNRHSEALEHINKAITEEDYNLEYRNLRRQIYIRQNNPVLADQDYQFIISQNSEYFGNYKAKAEQEKNNGNYQAAIENYKLALTQDIDSRELLEAKAWVYHSLRQYDSALFDFERVSKLSPDYLSYFNVAYTLDLMGKFKESIENYNKSIELKNDNHITYNNRGYEFYKLKNYKKAEEDYTKSIELNGDYHLSLYNRGLLYYELKKYQKAIDDYKNALKIGENRLDITYSLALTYDKFKKKEDAIITFNSFLELAGEKDSVRVAYSTKRIAELNK